MIQHFEKMRLIMEKYEEIYRRNIELHMTADGDGEIMVDASRCADFYLISLMKWNNWEEFASKLRKVDEKKLVADPSIMEQVR